MEMFGFSRRRAVILLGTAILFVWLLPVNTLASSLDDESPSPALRRRGRQRRDTEQEQLCPLDPSVEVAVSLDASTLDTIFEASQLVQIEPRQDPDDVIEANKDDFLMFHLWRDLDDRVILAKSKKDGTCHLNFGIPGGTVFDQWQNLNPLTEKIGDCVVRAGFVGAYNMSDAEEMHAALQVCLHSCRHLPNRQCPLATSGYSQGGGVAIVAAIDLARYNPITITFGATPAIVNTKHILSFIQGDWPCTDFVPENHYQFVNFLLGHYDCVALGINPFSATHVGRLLLLDEDTDFYIGSPGVFNVTDDSQRRPTQNSPLHWPGLYGERLERIRMNGCTPLPIGKWPLEHWCNYDDECSSDFCGEDNECVPKP